MANYTTGAQRHNARQDKIWEAYKSQRWKKLEEHAPKLLAELEHVVNRLEVLNQPELTPFQRSFIAGLTDHVKEVIKNATN